MIATSPGRIRAWTRFLELADSWSSCRRMAIAAMALGALAAAPRDADAQCPVTLIGATRSPSLQIMTFNAAIQVAPGDNEDMFDQDFEDRAREIAALILADNPDVVALAEVNQNASKDVFVAELQGRYPSFVSFVDANNPLNDSGLMLFSKFLFAMPDTGLVSDDVIVEFENQGVTNVVVNARIYPGIPIIDGDWWANKAVAMVRILNECDLNAPFNVAFTHMQASDEAESDWWYGAHIAERQREFEIVRELIEFHVNAGNRLTQPIFVAGDLNVNGNLQRDPMRNMMLTNLSGTVHLPFTEWQHTFDATNPGNPISDQHGGFFSCRGACASGGVPFLTDAWGFETSRLDPGQTSSTGLTGGSLAFPDPKEGARVDYILHNHPVFSTAAGPTTRPALCMQHVTRGFSPIRGLDLGFDLSDHLPVTADFNRPAARCSMNPRIAAGNVFGPGEVDFNVNDPSATNFKDVTFNGSIAFPGSVQWYAIDQAYPYRITLTGSNVSYRVYQGADMSKPLPPYAGKCTDSSSPFAARRFSCDFPLYEPPYFIKVFASSTTGDSDGMPDRTRAGLGYQINFHRFDCSSVAEACILEPAKRVGHFVWPQGPLNPGASPPDDNSMFFELWTELARDGQSPEITFLLDHDFPIKPNLPDPLSMTLIDKNGLLVCTPPSCPNNDGLDKQEPETPDWNPDSNGDGNLDRLATARDATLPGNGTWTEQYFLKVTRDPAFQAMEKNVWVTYETDLTYFRAKDLTCQIERTDVGEDDIDLEFAFGGDTEREFMPGWWFSGREIGPAGSANWVWGAEFPAELEGGVVKRVIPRIWEDVLDGDDFELESRSGPQIDALDRSTHSEIWGDLHSGTFVWSDEADPDDADYRYFMNYNLTHSRPPCKKPDSQPSAHCVLPRFCDDGACKLP